MSMNFQSLAGQPMPTQSMNTMGHFASGDFTAAVERTREAVGTAMRVDVNPGVLAALRSQQPAQAQPMMQQPTPQMQQQPSHPMGQIVSERIVSQRIISQQPLDMTMPVGGSVQLSTMQHQTPHPPSYQKSSYQPPLQCASPVLAQGRAMPQLGGSFQFQAQPPPEYLAPQHTMSNTVAVGRPTQPMTAQPTGVLPEAGFQRAGFQQSYGAQTISAGYGGSVSFTAGLNGVNSLAGELFTPNRSANYGQSGCWGAGAAQVLGGGINFNQMSAATVGIQGVPAIGGSISMRPGPMLTSAPLGSLNGGGQCNIQRDGFGPRRNHGQNSYGGGGGQTVSERRISADELRASGHLVNTKSDNQPMLDMPASIRFPSQQTRRTQSAAPTTSREALPPLEEMMRSSNGHSRSFTGQHGDAHSFHGDQASLPTADAMHGLGPVIPTASALPQADPHQAAPTVLTQATVLPIPEEYMAMLTNLEDIKRLTGCEILVNEPVPPGREWEVSLIGTPEARQEAHTMIEESISSQIKSDADPTQSGYASHQQPQSPETTTATVTVIPIPREYFQLLTNLKNIEDITGCRIQVKEPDAGCIDYELSVFGEPGARKMAHLAVEDTLQAALQQFAEQDSNRY